MGSLRSGFRWFEDDEEELESWKAAVAAETDYDKLHVAMINWSTILGKLALDDDPGRTAIGRRMNLIGDRIDQIGRPGDARIDESRGTGLPDEGDAI